MTVALTPAEMRLSEVVIIYLAIAAPFGVAFFLRRPPGARRGRAVDEAAKAAGAALVWPACLLARFAREARAKADGESRRRVTVFDEKRVERAKRETINALRRVEDALVRGGRLAGEAERYAFFAARECAERYAGLALACEGARADAAPSARELELCRVAGRAGEDLIVAGRCAHRRNVTRLLAHRARARIEFEGALSAIREASRGASQGQTAGGAEHSAAAALSQAASGAAELFTALGEEAAAARTTRLFAAGGAVPRAELEDAAGVQISDGTGDEAGLHISDGTAKGVRSCTTPAAPTAFANPPRRAATYTRG